MKFPHDVPIQRVLHTFHILGFDVVRTGNHIALERTNPDGTKTPMTIPNHETIKGSTLRTICTQAGISRDAFLEAFEKN
jgi:predicted RNA binding protein YcfA (HicA-like mRNA interferase family)